jgi:hypothetical protein
MSPKKAVAGLAAIAVLAVGSPFGGPARAQGVCEATPTVTDHGCPGCQTDIVLVCDSVPGECEGCTYDVWASITCPPTIQVVTGQDELECGGKYERQFGGCGTGPA